MRNFTTPTPAKVRELLEYNPDSGLLFWRNQPKNGTNIKKAAGCLSREYVVIRFGYKTYKAHRLAWLIMTGTWPKMIDHINRIKTDNRWSNLRESSSSENAKNRVATAYKITNEQVAAIRESKLCTADLAKIHGISARYVNSLRKGEWRS